MALQPLRGQGGVVPVSTGPVCVLQAFLPISLSLQSLLSKTNTWLTGHQPESSDQIISTLPCSVVLRCSLCRSDTSHPCCPRGWSCPASSVRVAPPSLDAEFLLSYFVMYWCPVQIPYNLNQLELLQSESPLFSFLESLHRTFKKCMTLWLYPHCPLARWLLSESPLFSKSQFPHLPILRGFLWSLNVAVYIRCLCSIHNITAIVEMLLPSACIVPQGIFCKEGGVCDTSEHKKVFKCRERLVLFSYGN